MVPNANGLSDRVTPHCAAVHIHALRSRPSSRVTATAATENASFTRSVDFTCRPTSLFKQLSHGLDGASSRFRFQPAGPARRSGPSVRRRDPVRAASSTTTADAPSLTPELTRGTLPSFLNAASASQALPATYLHARFVRVEKDWRSFLLRNLHRDDLVFEPSGFDRSRCFAMCSR